MQLFSQITHEKDRDAGEHFRRLLTALFLCHFLRLSGEKKLDIFCRKLKKNETTYTYEKQHKSKRREDEKKKKKKEEKEMKEGACTKQKANTKYPKHFDKKYISLSRLLPFFLFGRRRG